ncbi:tachylectin-related carbohydrate-binding protein [Amycolatopsis roodepoortensis]|uniref:tachylectin-related carbohydrate-binding protein n=1 Tax=Amycolatopsis roodepoortensis TaxID=700274 RepID=UPI00214B377F|nr:tachylectin-related carbohydrate-binding protein [Amycolatopsis roodepoortensis]UUV28429.1 tachylectin-related carbohydrate-binding protein [Amycolatopsis roodepoortensis]
MAERDIVVTRFRRSAGIAILATTVAVTAPVPLAGPAVAAETLQCDTAANIYTRRPDTGLNMHINNEPELPSGNWGTERGIGFNWAGIMLGGPDGLVYHLTEAGEVYQRRWTSSGWENGGTPTLIATGWAGWGSASARNRMTIDAKGDFFGFPSDKALHWWRYDQTAKTWTERVIDVGWGDKYNMIFASGEGQLFARTPAGQLHGYRYHAESDRWLEYGRVLGDGWQNITDVAGVGGGVFYAVVNNEALRWHRYLGNGAWATGSGTQVGAGWRADWLAEGDSDACKLVGQAVPTRPAVPANFTARNTAVQGDDGLMNYFYVNNAGGLTHAKQRRTSEWNLIDHQTFPDYFKYTGQPTAATHPDGKLEVLAHSYDDADVRGKLQTAKNSTWQAGVKAHSGRMLSSPSLVKGSDNLMTAFATDVDGNLWYRKQLVLWGAPVQGGYGAWRSLGGAGLTADLSVVRNGDGFEVVGRHGDGSVRVARFVGDTLGAWRNLGGTDVTGVPATVAHSDGKLQVVVRRADGKIYTQRETSAGFPGTWQPIDGITAKGSPAAVVTSRGTVEITVLSSDSLIYSTGQTNAGGVFRDWEVRDLHEAGTDPTAVMLPDDSWAVSWRGPQGEIYTYRGIYGAEPTQRSAAAKPAPPVYTGGKAHS